MFIIYCTTEGETINNKKNIETSLKTTVDSSKYLASTTDNKLNPTESTVKNVNVYSIPTTTGIKQSPYTENSITKPVINGKHIYYLLLFMISTYFVVW
jgi:hypothetical protein